MLSIRSFKLGTLKLEYKNIYSCNSILDESPRSSRAEFTVTRTDKQNDDG